MNIDNNTTIFNQTVVTYAEAYLDALKSSASFAKYNTTVNNIIKAVNNILYILKDNRNDIESKKLINIICDGLLYG